MNAEPTNQDRAGWAQQALEKYADITGLDTITPDAGEAPDEDIIENRRTAVVDLLADLQHFCAQNDISFEDALDSARNHYTEELAEEELMASDGPGR